MTITVICEKTGIEFQAATKRTKNHPKIMTLLNQANREGWYGVAMSALEQGRKDGLATIEQFIAAMEAAKERWQAEADKAYREKMQRERDIKEAQRERHITNNLLRGRGYVWHDLGFASEEDADAFSPNLPIGHDWQLFSPDDRAVSLQEAMQELAWQGVAFAKEWLVERKIAEVKPAIEVQREAEAAVARQEIEQLDAESLEYQQEAEQALLRAGVTKHKALIESVRLAKPHAAQQDYVKLAKEQWTAKNDLVTLAMDGDLVYGVRVNGVWHSRDNALALPDLPREFRSKLEEL